MTTKALSSEIIRNLSYLKKDEQNQVLVYIKSIINKKNGGRAGLINLAGSLNVEEARQMMHEIEMGCENIDPNEWK